MVWHIKHTISVAVGGVLGSDLKIEMFQSGRAEDQLLLVAAAEVVSVCSR